MSSKGISQRIKLQSFDDMFDTEEKNEVIDSGVKPVDGQIVEIPLSELHTFKNHPFRVVDDENMEEMVESVKEYGVLVPAIARPGEDYPYSLVKSKFLKLNSTHLEYVIGCMKNNTTKVSNIKAYLTTALYNAPNTINHYYTAEVNHDMYGTM